VPRYVVTEIREGARFRMAYDRLVRIGPPYMDAILRARVGQVREELTAHGAAPPDVTPHPDLDGSYVIEREGLRVRYYVTRAPRASWLDRLFRRRISTEGATPVRVWLQALDWPDAERLIAG
jgi:hypothetical protein